MKKYLVSSTFNIKKNFTKLYIELYIKSNQYIQPC